MCRSLSQPRTTEALSAALSRKGWYQSREGELYLTTEGQEIYDEFSGSEFSEVLLTWQFEANDLYEGDQTGRCIGFPPSSTGSATGGPCSAFHPLHGMR